jgi:hypothetical protein
MGLSLEILVGHVLAMIFFFFFFKLLIFYFMQF